MGDLSVWAAVASAFFAAIAVWYTYRSANIARKSLELTQEQERRRTPNLEPYLIDGHILRVRLQEMRVYVFSISITNKSDAENSVKELRFAISFNRGQGPDSTIIVTHDASLAKYSSLSSPEPLSIPLSIAAYQTIQGMALFRTDDTLLQGTGINAYSLQIIDSHNTQSILRPIILQEKEMSDEE